MRLDMRDAESARHSFLSFEAFLQDLRYGVRSLLRTPGFVLAAVLALALGSGANTAIFTVVNAVLLRPLAYPEPERIAQFVWRTRDGDRVALRGNQYLHFRDTLKSVDALAAWRGPTGFNLSFGDSAEYVKAMPVSKEFFTVFGVRPEYGDPFGDDHDRAGGADAVVLGYGLWTRMFGSDPSIVGRSVLLGDRSYMVLGVMPRSFQSMPPADLYVPLKPSTTGPGSGQNYRVAGRLKRGITIAQATAEAASVYQSIADQFPGSRRNASGRPFDTYAFVPFQSSMTESARPALLLMLGAVALLLLIACANTANLLLARASTRGREMAVRVALGASRVRIIRQLLTESALLFTLGGAAGVFLAYWTVPALLALTPAGYTVYQDVRIDAIVLVTMLGVSIITGLLFGLAPAMGLSRHELVAAFKDDATRTTGSRRSRWMRKALVVAEVALSMVLLVGAGLLIQTFMKMRAIDPGFNPHGLLTARMSLQGDRYGTTQDVNRLFDHALERIRQIPGVTAASVVNCVPIERGLNMNVDVLDGPEHFEGMATLTDWRYASLDYFTTMGIPIVAGRGFSDADRAGAAPVAVVSEAFARHFFKNTNPLGHHIGMLKTPESIEVVGVAKDLREGGELTGPPVPIMYVPVTQADIRWVRASHTYFPMSWVIRTANNGPQTIKQIREAVRLVDPRQPFSSFVTMDEIKAQSMADETFQMTLLTLLAGIGLVLAFAGIYGLIAYTVAERTREIGIRVALGATAARILSAVVREGIVLAAGGVAIGVVAAAGLTRTLQDYVFGVSTLDPLTFAAVGSLLVIVAALASLVPAVRAIRLKPTTALRE
jgi:putative ABC transport system permease protein